MAFPLEKKLAKANGFGERSSWILSHENVRENTGRIGRLHVVWCRQGRRLMKNDVRFG